ncbi:DUF4238 domain-containing protein [Dactylosporangium cerinum]|uniref:DUF4238 domain-containing protein n=1 Tax=Dactylosporangium cerinum TaxID=1434730 RepID=A0ABV9VY29_9ACTN
MPQFLLELFADRQRRLTVYRLKATGPHIASIRDVGHRNLGHTIYMPGRNPDHETLEKGMSEIEGAAASVIRDLLASRKSELSPEHREVLSWFIALQWQRHRMLLDLVRVKVLQDHPMQPTDPEYEYATKSLGLHAILTNVIWPWKNRNDPMCRPKERWNHIVSRLEPMFWKTLRPRAPSLLVGDTTACLSGIAIGNDFDLPVAYANHGIGLGFENFQRLTAPLAPTLGLVISRSEDDARKITSRAMNRFTVGNSREFVAHSPEWPNAAPSLFGAMVDELTTQRWLAQHIFPGLRA